MAQKTNGLLHYPWWLDERNNSSNTKSQLLQPSAHTHTTGDNCLEWMEASPNTWKYCSERLTKSKSGAREKQPK